MRRSGAAKPRLAVSALPAGAGCHTAAMADRRVRAWRRWGGAALPDTRCLTPDPGHPMPARGALPHE